MLRTCILLSALLLLAEPAIALEVKSCDEANIGLTELIPPVGKNSRTYKDDKISVYVVDTVEPVCCAAGVAVVIPDIEDELGAINALPSWASLRCSSTRPRREDDPTKGLLITIPTRVFNEAANSAPGEPMKLRVNVEKGTLVAE